MTRLQRFIAFHKARPEVYVMLRDVCLDFKGRGRTKWSIWGAFQVVRWQRHFQRVPGEDFKLSNDLTGYYARLLAAREPELREFFTMRPLLDGEPTGEEWAALTREAVAA